MKVLIVDDDLLTIKNIKYSFEQDNYEVESTDDSNEALKRSQQTSTTLSYLILYFPIRMVLKFVKNQGNLRCSHYDCIGKQ